MFSNISVVNYNWLELCCVFGVFKYVFRIIYWNFLVIVVNVVCIIVKVIGFFCIEDFIVSLVKLV